MPTPSIKGRKRLGNTSSSSVNTHLLIKRVEILKVGHSLPVKSHELMGGLSRVIAYNISIKKFDYFLHICIMLMHQPPKK